MKKLVESYFGGTHLNEEEVEGQKHLYIDGVMAQAELKNKNGRWYSRPVLQEAVDDYNQEFIATKRSYGELGHPEGDEVNVNLSNACVLITKLMADPQNPNNFIGRMRVLEGTPKGDLLAGLLRNGGNIGTSTRCMGLMNEDESVVTKCIMFAIDPVWNSSAPGAAIMEAIMEEKKLKDQIRYSTRAKYLNECYAELEAARKEVRRVNEAKQLKDFKEFLENI